MALFKKFQVASVAKVAKVAKEDDSSSEVSQVSQVSQAPYLIQWKTKTGRVLYLITSEHIRDKASKDKAVFSLEELELMRNLPDEQIEAIIDTKEIFPGAIVEL